MVVALSNDKRETSHIQFLLLSFNSIYGNLYAHKVSVTCGRCFCMFNSCADKVIEKNTQKRREKNKCLFIFSILLIERLLFYNKSSGECAACGFNTEHIHACACHLLLQGVCEWLVQYYIARGSIYYGCLSRWNSFILLFND